MDKFVRYLNWEQVQKTLLDKRLNPFSLEDFVREFDLDKDTAIKFLSRHKKKDNIKQLKRGLYSLTIKRPSLYLVANRLYRPSYLSFETALSHHNIIPETIYSLTSATPKASQEFSALGNRFVYHSLKEEAYFGYEPRQVRGDTILIATPEKAVLDFLYFVHRGQKSLNDRMKVTKLNLRLLEEYAEQMGNPNLVDLLDELPDEEVIY